MDIYNLVNKWLNSQGGRTRADLLLDPVTMTKYALMGGKDGLVERVYVPSEERLIEIYERKNRPKAASVR